MNPTRPAARTRALIAAIALAVVGPLLPHTPAAAGEAQTQAQAETQAQPEARASATVRHLRNLDHRLRGNFAGAGSQASFSTPAIADINGDSTPEIVTASVDGIVIAFRSNGTRLWARNLGRTSIQSSPAIGDINMDGRNDVVVGTMDGRVVVLNGPDGRILRTLSDGGLQGCRPLCFPRGFHATPAIADINGDRRPDIVATSFNHHVYAWSSNGSLLFRRDLYDTIWSSPVIVDLDKNGTKEIVVASDVEANNPVLGGPAGGVLWVLNRNGTNYRTYPKRVPGQVLWSSPAVGDINGDTLPDIVIGTGAFFPDPAGRQIHAFTGRSGNRLPGWPVTTRGRVVGSPALGDLTGDGRPEVVFTSEGGYLYAYNGTGTRRWITCERNAASLCSPGNSGTHASPAIADVDGDGRLEVLAVVERKLRIRDGATGALEAELNLGGTGDHRVPSGAPSVGEIGGQTVIAYQAHFRQGHSGAYARSGDIQRVQLLTTGTKLCQAPWSTFKADPGRSSVLATTSTWMPFACVGDFVDQQYQDFLGRDSDDIGRAFWSGRLRYNGSTGSWAINAFMRSGEFQDVIAPVVRAHLGLFGTYPRSAAAVRTDARRLRLGATPAQIAQDLVDGDNSIGTLSDEAFVRALHQNALGRPPTASELSTLVDRLGSGTGRGTVAAQVTEGTAGRAHLLIPVDVTMTYLGMLGRAPDAPGFAFWVPEARRTGADRLIRGFQGSAEYRNRVT